MRILLIGLSSTALADNKGLRAYRAEYGEACRAGLLLHVSRW